MDARASGQTVGRRFRQASARTLLARADSSAPIVMSHVLTSTPTVTARPELEAAFSIHVHLTPLRPADAWIDGRHRLLPLIETGGVCLFDMTTEPVAHVHEPMEFVRVHLSQRTLDDLAYDRGSRAVQGLSAPAFGLVDPVLHGLAAALAASLADEPETDPMFAEHVGLAFHARLASVYGQSAGPLHWSGGLAPWQIRRACEMMEAALADAPSLSVLARACGVSTSYFSRAFRQSVGVPPHQWLMRARIERAKTLLRYGDVPIAEIAANCGFADQSHLTRVFVKREGRTPARWRRLTTN